jgi:hypothetical protein
MDVLGMIRIRKLATAGLFWKKNGGSRSGLWPISIACAA